MSFRDRVRGALVGFIRGGSPPPSASERDAVRERAEAEAKEMADHKAWLRDNAASVTAPEHPAVALLREIEWDGDGNEPVCPRCGEHRDGGGHHADCVLAAILAGSKPGERALSELLAEEREKSRAEATAQHGAIEQAAFQAGKTHGAREAYARLALFVESFDDFAPTDPPRKILGRIAQRVRAMVGQR